MAKIIVKKSWALTGGEFKIKYRGKSYISIGHKFLYADDFFDNYYDYKSMNPKEYLIIKIPAGARYYSVVYGVYKRIKTK